MQVVDGLASPRAHVGHETPSGGVDSLRSGEVVGGADHLTEELHVLVPELSERGQVLLGYQEDVRRGLRVDVSKRQHMIGGENDVGLGLPLDDPTERAGTGHGPSRIRAAERRCGGAAATGGLVTELGQPLQQPPLLLA